MGAEQYLFLKKKRKNNYEVYCSMLQSKHEGFRNLLFCANETELLLGFQNLATLGHSAQMDGWPYAV